MSDKILKALIQLFALIAKQSGGPTTDETKFVHDFLHQQLDEKQSEFYYALFLSHLEEKKDNKHKGAAVLDSLAILEIAHGINETLIQKQKIIVLVRLFELVRNFEGESAEKIAIVETISSVFNINLSEYKSIKKFVSTTETDSNYIYLTDDLKVLEKETADTALMINRIKSVDVILLKKIGSSDISLNKLALKKEQIYVFASGGVIQQTTGKPVYFHEILARFSETKKQTALSFAANAITHIFPNGKQGLHDLSIAENSGNLVAIMGASGAGKTTLLNILSGMELPTTGEVVLNGINIHTQNDKIKGAIGFVPQDDLLNEDLTVFQNLYYNAELCFRDLKKEQIETAVLDILENLGLLEIKDLRVGTPLNKVISGGQRKRLNIALELIREPLVLFLDEPTSGLSSKDAKNVINLLNQLTTKGKLVFVVIHQPSSEIYKSFNKIILLDTGGYLIYYGNQIEAISYFKVAEQLVENDLGECPKCGNVDSESIFDIVESETVDEYGNYTGKRRISPIQWNEIYKKEISHTELIEVTQPPDNLLKPPSLIKQTITYFKRDLFSKFSNKQYLIINLLEAPLLAFILSFIVRYTNDSAYAYRENENIPAYIFICIIVFLFIGLSVSAEEIFKDKKLIKREQFLNLSRFSYLISKIGLLFLLSAIQCLLFVLVGNSILEVKGMYIDYWLMLFSVACCANIIGLIISSAFNSVVTIYIIIPLLIIPQMILGGAMFSYEKLNKFIGGGYQVPFVANLMPSRWAYEGLVVNQFITNDFEKIFYNVERKESSLNYVRGPYLSHMTNLVDKLAMSINKKSENDITEEDLKVLKTELIQLIQHHPKGSDRIDIHQINTQTISSEQLDYISEYLFDISSEYRSLLNTVVLQKERLNYSFQKTAEDQERFRNFKNAYYNDYLSDLVKKKFTKDKLVELNGKLQRVTEPIFSDAENDAPAPFFTPQKTIAGVIISTYYYNLVVIWCFSALLSLLLYYDLLRKILTLKSR